ncbi:MAG TPA: histidine--tRNA ligase [Solirubrobacterales bacterium]|jgi:histidyl-tRNA synthetase|nr:histidine--tRNA ligase [Solirubrobacterales bacterium]
MSDRIKAPRGTFDVLPEQQAARRRIEETARGLLEEAGYGRIDTPVFEETELFARGVGEATEVVQKQMFTFEDQGGRSLTLRPEATAAICRAYIEHGMQTRPQPVKLWSSGPFFRHERPQAGRYRQFHQIDAEAIGSDSPLVDAELILLVWDLITRLGVEGVELRLGSLGSPEARAAYAEELRSFLRGREGELAKEVRDRIDLNPLRAFDSADEGTQAVMADAPLLLDRLEGEDAARVAAVRELLDRAGVPYKVDATMVRGLDYYAHTIFELHCDRLGAQSQVGGGGRYDGLIEALGGPATPASGWAVGVERLALALGEEDRPPTVDVFIVADEGARERALALATELRRAGISTDLDLAGRSLKGQMKQADRSGARQAVLLEGNAAHLRDMVTGEQRDADLTSPVEELRAALAQGPEEG